MRAMAIRTVGLSDRGSPLVSLGGIRWAGTGFLTTRFAPENVFNIKMVSLYNIACIPPAVQLAYARLAHKVDYQRFC